MTFQQQSSQTGQSGSNGGGRRPRQLNRGNQKVPTSARESSPLRPSRLSPPRQRPNIAVNTTDKSGSSDTSDSPQSALMATHSQSYQHCHQSQQSLPFSTYGYQYQGQPYYNAAYSPSPLSSPSPPPPPIIDDNINDAEAMIPKTPTYEYYGFVLYLLSLLFFCIYISWAYLPDYILHRMGITYYLRKYWALAIPCYSLILVIFIFAATLCWDLWQTPGLDSIHTLTDDYAMILDKATENNRPSVFYDDEFHLEEYQEDDQSRPKSPDVMISLANHPEQQAGDGTSLGVVGSFAAKTAFDENPAVDVERSDLQRDKREFNYSGYPFRFDEYRIPHEPRENIPILQDLPITIINRCLYRRHPKRYR